MENNIYINYNQEKIYHIIKDCYEKGETLKNISKILNNNGYRTKRNKIFTIETIRDIVKKLNLQKRDIKCKYTFIRLTEKDYQRLLEITGDERKIPDFIRSQIQIIINRKEN